MWQWLAVALSFPFILQVLLTLEKRNSAMFFPHAFGCNWHKHEKNFTGPFFRQRKDLENVRRKWSVLATKKKVQVWNEPENSCCRLTILGRNTSCCIWVGGPLRSLKLQGPLISSEAQNLHKWFIDWALYGPIVVVRIDVFIKHVIFRGKKHSLVGY